MLTPRQRCLAALVLALGSLCPRSSARAADVRCFPDDTEAVITVNFKQIRASQLVVGEKDALDQPRALLHRLAGDIPVMRCLRDAGLDAVRDLTRVSFAGPRGKGVRPRFLILEGDFAALRLGGVLADLARVNPDALKISTAGGATVYEIGTRAGDRNYATLIGKTTLIAATTREALAGALARSDGTRKSGLANGLRAMLESTNDKQSISFVATGAALSALMDGSSVANAETAAAALKSIDGLSAAVTITREIEFQVGAYARDDETARRLAGASGNALLTLSALVRQKAREDEKLLPVVDIVKTLRVKSEGPVVVLRGEATLDAIERFVKNLPAGRTEAGPAASGR